MHNRIVDLALERCLQLRDEEAGRRPEEGHGRLSALAQRSRCQNSMFSPTLAIRAFRIVITFPSDGP